MVAQVLMREGKHRHPTDENRRQETRDLRGCRQAAGGHGGKPWIAITSSVSSHCCAVSYTVGEDEEARKHTQQPVENDERPFRLRVALGTENIVCKVNRSCARPKKSCVEDRRVSRACLPRWNTDFERI